MIRYPDHAEARMAERSISREAIEMGIRNPLEVIPVKYGRQACSQQSAT
ncbi:MAG: DUF4258 domain-containing protein [Nitrososphaerota archaeon]|nr:DUF4258 domain-containing protein [Nitrososphaerota archaeon]MDG6951667.1 DUF4258 domain-containing protein [Nitrososphaerota archaeon]